MDREVSEILYSIKLFAGLPGEQIQGLLDARENRIKKYKKGEFIFLEGDVPEKLFILITGKVNIAEDTLSGHRILVTDITAPGEMFGEVYLFMKQENYDVHAQAVEDSVIFEMSGEILTGKRTLLLQNLLGIFAEKAYSLNGKVRVLGGNSLREKIVRFMYENLRRRGMDYMEPGAEVKIGREDMAEYLNVARPSLSRELGRMQREGILRIQGRALSVKDSSSFEEYL